MAGLIPFSSSKIPLFGLPSIITRWGRLIFMTTADG